MTIGSAVVPARLGPGCENSDERNLGRSYRSRVLRIDGVCVWSNTCSTEP